MSEVYTPIEENTTRKSAPCEAATELRIAEVRSGHDRGWSFTPLKGKIPIQKGWQRANRSTREEAEEWARLGNIGLRTGLVSNGASGVAVIDLDRPDLPLDLPKTVTVMTGGGGKHFYFKVDRPIKNSAGTQLGAKIDIRGDGGQVVFVGSVHPETGGVYSWAPGLSPSEVDLAEFPYDLLRDKSTEESPKWGPPSSRAKSPPSPKKKRESSYTVSALEHERQAVASAPQGQRNHTLNTAAFNLGQLVGSGLLPRAVVESTLTIAARESGLHLDPECGEEGIRKTIASGIDAGMQKPRQIPPPPPVKTVLNANPADESRPKIYLGTDEHRVGNETIAALASDPGIFQRGCSLVRIIRENQPDDGINRPPGSPTIRHLPPANLRSRMTQCASFKKVNKKGDEVNAHPPAWLVNAVNDHGEWPGIRILSGISDTPVLRADGSIWQTPGYDKQTGVLFEAGGTKLFPTVHPDAGIDDADAALQRLLEVVCDFRFESPEHRAAWLAGLLTPLARFAFSGPSPLFLIDANIRGAGKGKLAQTIGNIVLGRELPVSSYSHEAEEMRKKITSIAMAGDRMILLDNLDGLFGNSALDSALTSTRWTDRLLGKNENVDLPLFPVWYATGNNVQVAADTIRRSIHIRLDVLEEKPEERAGFKHADLPAWTLRNRGSLLVDALTILSAYCRAGRPKHNLKTFGSFEGWSDLVREAVVWVGMPDPCLTRDELAKAADTSSDVIASLLEAWNGCFGSRSISVSQLMAQLYPQDRSDMSHLPDDVAMRSAIENMVGTPSGRTPTPHQVGKKLATYRRRVIGRRYLDIERTCQRAAQWKLCTSEKQQITQVHTLNE